MHAKRTNRQTMPRLDGAKFRVKLQIRQESSARCIRAIEILNKPEMGLQTVTHPDINDVF